MAKTIARVRDGLVEDVYTVPDGTTLAEFSPVNAPLLRECPADVRPGWSVVGDVWSAPPSPFPLRQRRQLAFLEVLKNDADDDEIVILREVLEIAIAEIEVIRQRVSAPATPKWTALVDRMTELRAKLSALEP